MKFGHTIIYVDNVEKTVSFYEKAFNVKKAFIDETKQYAQLETGATALGFASIALAKSNVGDFEPQDRKNKPAGFEVSFTTNDIEKAFKQALDNGCLEVAKPQAKPWGQTTAYVRDLNGILVELATEMH